MREQAHARHRCGRTFAQGRGLQTCARVQVRQAGWPEDQRKGQAYVGIPSRTDKKHAPNLDFAFGGDDFDFADVAWPAWRSGQRLAVAHGSSTAHFPVPVQECTSRLLVHRPD